MEKLCLVVLIMSLVAAMPRAQTNDAVKWAKRVVSENQTVTKLQFYFHDILSGSNPSAVVVAQSTNKSPTSFGSITMADDALTEGPDPNSKLLGRAQGFYSSAGRNELSLLMAMSYSFTDGIYNGSSFSLLGKNPAMNPVREMPIVGGTGVFRFARGYAIARTLSLNAAGDAVVGYNVTLLVDSSAGGGGNNNNAVDNTNTAGNNANTPGNNPNARTVDVNNFSPSASVFLNHLSVAIFSIFMVYCSVV